MSGNEERSGKAGGKRRPCDYPASKVRLGPIKRAYLIFELVTTNKPAEFVAAKFGISVQQVRYYNRRLKRECQRKQLQIDLIYYDRDGSLTDWKQ